MYFGQIDNEMKATLKENPDYQRAYNEKDVFTLRKMLREVNFNYKRTEEPFKTLATAYKDLLLRQNDSSLQEYYTRHEAMRKVVNELTASEHGSPFINIICRETQKDPTLLTNDEKEEMTKQGDERLMAMNLVLNADKKRYGGLIEEFDRAYLGNVNRYPKTGNEAYNLLKNWIKTPTSSATPPILECHSTPWTRKEIQRI